MKEEQKDSKWKKMGFYPVVCLQRAAIGKYIVYWLITNTNRKYLNLLLKNIVMV